MWYQWRITSHFSDLRREMIWSPADRGCKRETKQAPLFSSQFSSKWLVGTDVMCSDGLGLLLGGTIKSSWMSLTQGSILGLFGSGRSASVCDKSWGSKVISNFVSSLPLLHKWSLQVCWECKTVMGSCSCAWCSHGGTDCVFQSLVWVSEN